MRKIRAFFYVIKQSVVNLIKNWYMLLASVFVMSVTLFIMGCLLLTSANIRNILRKQAQHPEVEIICRNTVSDEASLDIAQTILSDYRVSACKRISRAENLEKMKSMLEGYEDLFQYENEDSSFLYVSFDVILGNSDDLAQFSEDMRKVSGVEAVQTNQSIYDYFTRISSWVKTGTVAASVVLGFLSVLLTYNTVRLTVFARRKELEIMKYLGASMAFMRGPFLLEGIVMGVISAGITYFVVGGTYRYLYDMLQLSESGIKDVITMIPYSDFSGNLLGFYMIAGIATGLLASMIAIRKYIKI